MQAYLHGGKCCGIKHIEGFPWRPGDVLSAKKASKANTKHEGDYFMRSSIPFFTDAAPSETGGERFDRIVEFIKTHRPQGVIEVVLAYYQLPSWQDFLFERGFKLVTKCKNSNSGNKIFIYHLAVE